MKHFPLTVIFNWNEFTRMKSKPIIWWLVETKDGENVPLLVSLALLSFQITPNCFRASALYARFSSCKPQNWILHNIHNIDVQKKEGES